MRLGAMPPDWNKLSKRDRMMRLGEYLGPNDTLQLFQEPKGTRKNKSLYWQALWNRHRPKVKPRPVQQLVGQPVVPRDVYARAQAAQRQAALQLNDLARNIWRGPEQGEREQAQAPDEPRWRVVVDEEGI